MTRTGSKIIEDDFNKQLGSFIQDARKDWAGRVQVETPGILESSSLKRPDILIAPDSLNPVAVECAFEGTSNIDQDAINRLGERMKSNIPTSRLTILTAIAAVVPSEIRSLRDQNAIRSWLNSKSNKFKYAAYSKDKDSQCEYDDRYPIGGKNSGYLEGNAWDFINFVEIASTPNASVQKVADRATNTVKAVAHMIKDHLEDEDLARLSEKVGQPEKENAAKVAACIWLNAMVLQARMAAATEGGGGERI